MKLALERARTYLRFEGYIFCRRRYRRSIEKVNNNTKTTNAGTRNAQSVLLCSIEKNREPKRSATTGCNDGTE